MHAEGGGVPMLVVTCVGFDSRGKPLEVVHSSI